MVAKKKKIKETKSKLAQKTSKEYKPLEIKLNGQHKDWVKKLVKNLNGSHSLKDGCMIIVSWMAIVVILALLICLWRQSLFLFDSTAVTIHGPLPFARNQVMEPVCEFNHPLTGECTHWKDPFADDKNIPPPADDTKLDLLSDPVQNLKDFLAENNTVDLNDQRLMAVMVENHPEARPQSGLSEAQVVYEALVEGGITRFMLIFDNLQNKDFSIGPVRSARPYYLWFAYELDNALYGHVGGSPEALNYIQSNGLNDCDEFLYGGIFYERISSRRAPHNTYTTVGDLEGCNDDAAMGRLLEIEPWAFMLAGEEKVISSPEVSEINIHYSESTYLAKWQYNQVERLYYRFYADGQPNIDKANNQQIATANIVVVEMPSHVIDDYGRLSMESIGSGPLIIYRKGEKVEGTWEKETKDARIKFLDENGDDIELVPGKVWVSVVPDMEIVEEK